MSVFRISCMSVLLLCCCYVTKGASRRSSSVGECRGATKTPCSARELYLPDFFCVYLGCCLHTTSSGKACYKKEKNVASLLSISVSTSTTTSDPSSALSNSPPFSTSPPSVPPQTTMAPLQSTQTPRAVPVRTNSRGRGFNTINRPRPTPFKVKATTVPFFHIALIENKNPPKKQSRPNSNTGGVVPPALILQEATTTSVASSNTITAVKGSSFEGKLSEETIMKKEKEEPSSIATTLKEPAKPPTVSGLDIVSPSTVLSTAGKGKSMYTKDEQQLLTNVEKELSELKNNISTNPPIITRALYTIKAAMTTSRTLTQTPLLQMLLQRRSTTTTPTKATVSSTTTTTTTTTTTSTTTTPPKTTTTLAPTAATTSTTNAKTTTSQQINLPVFTNRPLSGIFVQERPNVPFFERNSPRTPPRSLSQVPQEARLPSSPSRQSFDEFIAVLLLEQLKRQRENVLPPPPPTCELDDKDACCRLDPTAPCCEFQQLRDLANRAAPTTRIVGGTMAGSLRSSVAYLSKLPYRNHFCGGTLINNRWVLTAAHCALEYCHGLRPNSELLVSLGKYRKGAFLRDPGQQDISVRDVVCHHNQCKAGRSLPRLNDVALLHLMWPARFSSTIFPALMPQQYESPMPNKDCIVLGFGKTRGTGYENVMKQVTVPLIPNKQCNLPNWRDCSVRACMMCAGGINADPCDGDSGGPLFCPRANGLYVLHGVYSWGRCGVEVRKPAVYTRASYFVDWVSRVTQTFAASRGINRLF